MQQHLLSNNSWKGLQICNSIQTGNMAWNTIAHIIPSILCLVSMPLAIVINKKLYRNIKNEEHLEKGKVIQSIIKRYALVQCIAYPCIVVALIGGKIAVDMIPPEVARYVISSFIFTYTLYLDYVKFHSFVVALCRYTFLILSTQAETIGISRLKAIFIGCSIAVPTVTNLIYSIIHPLDDITTQWFYGQDYSGDEANQSDFSKKMNLISTYDSPLYLLYNEYCPETLKLGMNVLDVFIVMTVYSNIPEGFMYIHLYIFSKRYTLLVMLIIRYIYI